ncbi:hypothetical protein [Bradyrhizobium sp. USDA 10063]
MNIHQSPPTTKWVAVTDEILDRLHIGYCLWIDDLTEVRERMDALRDAAREGWKPSDELRERLDDLNERDELYAAKHMVVARAFLDAAEADVTATKPKRDAAHEHLRTVVIPMLKHAWENGWERIGHGFTPEERNELTWLIYCNPELKSLRRIAVQNTIYFWKKLEKLRCQYEANVRAQLKPNLKPNLGMKRFGKGIRK